jgi:hypothetical protein
LLLLLPILLLFPVLLPTLDRVSFKFGAD